MISQATNNNALIQQLVNTEVEDKVEATEADIKAEQKVLKYWKTFLIKQTIDLMLECLDNVIPATVSHAGCKILEGLPANMLVHTGDRWPVSNMFIFSLLTYVFERGYVLVKCI